MSQQHLPTRRIAGSLDFNVDTMIKDFIQDPMLAQEVYLRYFERYSMGVANSHQALSHELPIPHLPIPYLMLSTSSPYIDDKLRENDAASLVKWLRIDERIPDRFPVLPNLERLSITSLNIPRPSQMTPYRYAKHLTLVNIEDAFSFRRLNHDLPYLNSILCSRTTCCLDDLRDMAYLRNLNITQTAVIGNLFAYLRDSNLLSLSIKSVSERVQLGHLQIPKLRKLTLEGVTDLVLDSVRGVPALETLTLIDSTVQDPQSLKDMKHLKRLNLIDCTVPDDIKAYLPEGCFLYAPELESY